MKQAEKRIRNVVYENSRVSIATSRNFQGSHNIDFAFFFATLFKQAIPRKDFTFWVIGNATKYIDFAVFFGEEFGDVIDSEVFRPEVLADDEDSLFRQAFGLRHDGLLVPDYFVDDLRVALYDFNDFYRNIGIVIISCE